MKIALCQMANAGKPAANLEKSIRAIKEAAENEYAPSSARPQSCRPFQSASWHRMCIKGVYQDFVHFSSAAFVPSDSLQIRNVPPFFRTRFTSKKHFSNPGQK